MRAKDGEGRYGEEAAVQHLAAAGRTVLERTWSCEPGEIGVAAPAGGCLVPAQVEHVRGVA